MYQKTDSPEFTAVFLWQLALLSLIVLALVLFSDKLMNPDQRHPVVETPPIVIYPWVIAAGHTIQNGLLAFSGKPAEAVNGKDQVRALATLIVVMVFLPTVFLLRWRRRALAVEPTMQTTSWSLSRVFYFICGVLVIYLSVGALPIAVYGEMMRNRLRDAHAVQTDRDAIVTELNFLDYDLFQYYVLPKEAGGGNHSFDGYTLRENFARTGVATYKVTTSSQTVSLHAESIHYPSASINVKVDSLGRMAWWVYKGKFE